MQNLSLLRPTQYGRRHFADIFKGILHSENVLIPTKMSLEFVPEGLINNIPALAQIMDWLRPGHKPLSEQMIDRVVKHKCVTQPQ